MQPSQLKAENFNGYPPEARALALREIDLLRMLPLNLLPLLLRQAVIYDWRFPAERTELDDQFAYLRKLSPAQLTREMSPFTGISVSPDLEQLDWVNNPAQFSEKFTAHLWATHQMDAFRQASLNYVRKVNAASIPKTLPTSHLGLIVIGQSVAETKYPLFRKLRQHGVQFTNVAVESGFQILFELVKARAKAYPTPFGHWYIDGGTTDLTDRDITCISYQGLEVIRARLLGKMVATLQSGGGPELLRTELAEMRPGDVGLPEAGPEAVLSRFKLTLLTEGSGTQIFSTTFAQWAARESLRRAQPLTLLVRFAPRQRESSFVTTQTGTNAVDPEASLIDADMGAYYTWINQGRLPGAERSAFLVWFEGHNQAFAAGPLLAKGTTDSSRVSLHEIINRIT